MKVPLEWLNEFVVVDLEPGDLAKRLTMRGLEVEGVEELRPSFGGVVAGKITKVDRHPNADTLSLCRVDTGREILPVVCGAPNVQEGQTVPLALPGAVMMGNMTIEKRVIRGVESFGMICSEKELGLSDDHSGIFVLPEDILPGRSVEDLPWVSDSILDINVPPNRGDCLSIFGIAREVGSILDQKAKLPLFTLAEERRGHVKDHLSLAIETLDGCPRYVLRMIKDINPGPSPFWMRRRLSRCGMRPISAIVDVTNYVMLELGQPLHAFDYERLRGHRIEVKCAGGKMPFRTLDGVDRQLGEGDVLICDGEGPVAIAGIMGGENSEITAATRNVALESAYFNPLFIRKTARTLGIKSEASLRFEKGIDFDHVDFASQRAIDLMHRIAGGRIVRGKVEVIREMEPRNILVSLGNISGILGTYVEEQEVSKALRSIDLHILREEDKGLVVSVPNFRHDLEGYMDVIEEVARIFGFDHIPPTRPLSVLRVQKKDRKNTILRSFQDYLLGAGFSEIINFAFMSGRDLECFLIPSADERMSAVRVMNPLSKEQEMMRTFMAPGVLRTLAYNLNRGTRNLRFFETGKIFFQQNEGLPLERMVICCAMTGKERDYFWREGSLETDFFDLKGAVEGLLNVVGLTFSVDTTREPFLNTYKSADILVNGEKVGWMGELRDDVLKTYDIDQKVYCAEVFADTLGEAGETDRTYRLIPRYPPSTRDFAFFVDDRVAAGTLMERIKELSPLVASVGIFDTFRKEERSIAFRVVFQSYEETLTDERVNGIAERIIKELTSIDGVRLRS